MGSNDIVVYHSSSESFDKFLGEINWFSKNKKYTYQYGYWLSDEIYTYTCKIDISNFLDMGDTSLPAYNPYVEELVLSDELREVLRKLNMTDDEFKPYLDKIKDEYAYDGDTERDVRLYTIARSKIFKEVVVKAGYRGLITIESGYTCYAVYNASEIKILLKKVKN